MQMPRWLIASAAVALIGLAGCDIPRFTAESTSKVLVRAQPSLKAESDFELAARAIPGTLKTIEGFWVVDSANPRLIGLLTEGFCQYAVGFVEDEVELAAIKKDYEMVEYHSARATKMFLRCMNYALMTLGKKWQEDLFASDEVAQKRIDSAGTGQRTALMWAAVGLAGAIKNNKDRVEMIGYIDVAKAMLRKVAEIDAKRPPRDKALAALPHIALGQALTAVDKTLGGDPETAGKHFDQAIALTDGKFLLAEVYKARWVHFRNKDKKAFHDTMVKVLSTPPSIWPEQRLANEIAHRRARRYLKQEQELFP